MTSAPRIDLHCHGGGGASFEGGEDEIERALAFHRAAGTDGIVASLPSLRLADLVESLARLRAVAARDETLLGAHLEGPFLGPARRGAHAANALLAPTTEHVDAVLRAGEGIVRQVTVAPELPGAAHAIARFAAEGWVVAIGHTDAGGAEARAAFDAGATLVTHLFNGMRKSAAGRGPEHPGPSLADADAGLADTALADPRVTVEVIADGLHVPPAGIAEAFARAPGRVALVTDALPAAGAGDGRYRLGGVEVEVRDGRATIAGADTLAGSLITLADAERFAVEQAGVSPEAARAAVTTTPARVLGLAS